MHFLWRWKALLNKTYTLPLSGWIILRQLLNGNFSIMSNHYFQFKQFTVQQEHCAMKVCTDACLFGALIAETIQNRSIANILDIGTGTGLLSLLLAQKTTVAIDAVEIDPAAYRQAKQNMEASPWQERLQVFNADITSFNSNKKYDCIISNPPFFEGDLKSNNQHKNAAKHDTTLTLEQLLQAVLEHLDDDGIFALLLPLHRMSACIIAAEKSGLHLRQKTLVKQTPTHDYFRGILTFGKLPAEPSAEDICIKNETGAYSNRFTQLLKDYYLYL